MKKTNISRLKTSIEIFYTILYYILVIGIVIVYGLIFSDKTDSLISIPVSSISHPKLRIAIVSFCVFVLMYIFFRGVHHLLKSMISLEKGNYFNEEVIFRFTKTAKLFLIASIGGIILQFISPLILESKISLSINTDIVFTLFLMIIGLFFKFLSQVFDKARILQKENELTI